MEYHGYRRRYRGAPHWPAVVVGAVAAALVVGFLVPGWYAAAGATAGAYTMYGGAHVDGRYRLGGFTLAAALLLVCASTAQARGAEGWAYLLLAGAAAPTIGAAVLGGRPPGRGGVIGGPPASHSIERRPGEMPADRRGGR